MAFTLPKKPSLPPLPGKAPAKPPVSVPPPPPPKFRLPERAEQEFFEAPDRGRKELERVCAEQGKAWGIIRFRTESPGSDRPAKTTMLVMIGELYETEGTDTEDAILALAKELEAEGGVGAV